MKLYLNNNINPDEWNRLVGAHVFHRYEWRWVIEKAYGLKPSFAMAIDKGNFALFPSFRINNYCLSMPFTYVTGFLTNSPSLSKKIERHFNLENYSLRYKAIQKNDIENGQITAIVEMKYAESSTTFRKTGVYYRKAKEYGTVLSALLS